MSSDTAAESDQSGPEEEQNWKMVAIGVVSSVILATGLHYLLLSNVDMHPTLHALLAIILFFLTGFVVFHVIMG